MKMLIIEDDINVATYVKDNLTAKAHSVDTIPNGIEGSYMARVNAYDLIIIDYSLPDKNGLDVCSEIRNSGSNSAILFLSMNQNVQNKIQCLEAGADDYMTKPFSIEELNARIRALSRRPRNIESNIIYYEDLILDTKTQIVKRNDLIIYLTRTEYSILEFLLKNKYNISTKGMIIEYVWDSETNPFSNSLEAHIANLRKKIGKIDGQEIIKNIAGRGYVIGQ
jgi:DNA-binding response OmpR family regulator